MSVSLDAHASCSNAMVFRTLHFLYLVTADEMGDPYDMRDHTGTPTMMRPGEKPTLHEILMAEKMDFEAKVQRAAKRKRWLKG